MINKVFKALGFLSRQSVLDEEEQKIALAKNPKTPIHLLEALSEDWYVSKALIQNPEIPTELIDKIVRSNPSLLPDANSLNLTVPFLNYFLLNKKKDCYFAVAQFLKKRDLRCVEWVLKGYAQSEHSIVRFLTLLHPQLPTEVAIAASNSPSWLERWAIAQNPNTSSEVCQELAEDGNRIVRSAAATSIFIAEKA